VVNLALETEDGTIVPMSTSSVGASCTIGSAVIFRSSEHNQISLRSPRWLLTPFEV
jgi:hypothetical protein